MSSRIVCVDCETKGRVQRRVFHAHAPGLLPLEAKTNGWPLPGDVDLVRVRSDVETDVDYDANHPALARLLAAQPRSEVSLLRSIASPARTYGGQGGQKSKKFELAVDKAGRRESSTFRVIDRFICR